MILNLATRWVEIFAFVLLIIGFIFSLAAPSAVLSYIIIFAVGLIGGRLIYLVKGDMAFPYLFVLVGFLIGYLVGSRYGSWLVTGILFVLGSILSYYLHEEGYMKGWRMWA